MGILNNRVPFLLFCGQELNLCFIPALYPT